MSKRKERQTRTMDCKFNIREDGSEKRLEGYFSVFGGVYELWSGATESIDPHAFDDALSDDIRVLIDHETRLVLGRTTAKTAELRVDETGLFGSVLINEADQDALNLYARVLRGEVSQASFGFDILDETMEEQRTEDGKYTVHWTIKKVKLYEVSVVTFPAYRDTEIAARKADFDEIQKRRITMYKNTLLERLRSASRKNEEE